MYPVAVAKVVETLGGPLILGEAVHDLAGLTAAVARGFPRSVVREVATHAAPARGAVRNQVAALVASPATLKRSTRLSPDASARAERLARVIALAERALGSTDEAQAWLTDPHPMLGSMPIEAAATDLGARQVERLLHNIEHDLPA
jgi:putative toxin-antitoxin system antitoxin component (TIGR02293 family)